IAHPVRLKMVQLLLNDQFTVGELAEECSVPQNVASEHLKLLERCGLFCHERKGNKVFYQVTEPMLESFMSCIENKFDPPSQNLRRDKGE
ncbi:metalloregulator ArsR/SmtB family transcription factor, partial [bacterium]|nr:metalloregulator ArsR/SmtB family transcription factor [bacterium]MBU1917453.1 metalloregulator ArsR/SmtB family transcription factor [bacterium]